MIKCGKDTQRVLIITDSLGCPREETPVDQTWVDRVLRDNNSQCVFYTYCSHGLFFKRIPVEYISEINPGIIIVQVGVVDACRRTMSIPFETIVRKIPIISAIVHYLAKKYHFQLTRIREIHYTSIQKIYEICCDIVKKTNGRIYFIEIAPSSSVMEKKVFNFKNDVDSYNEVFRKVENEYPERVRLLCPYRGRDELFLSDGHHLNNVGMELVYKCVDEVLKKEEL